jgi:hypothetical protein
MADNNIARRRYVRADADQKLSAAGWASSLLSATGAARGRSPADR